MMLMFSLIRRYLRRLFARHTLMPADWPAATRERAYGASIAAITLRHFAA